MVDVIIPSIQEFVDNYLTNIRNNLIQNGASNPQVTTTSDWGIGGLALMTEIFVQANNSKLISNSTMADTATTDDLDRQLTIFGLNRRPASNSRGSVIVTASSPSLVPVGAQLINSSGLKYAVTIGGSYGNGAAIPVQSINTGSLVNVPAGTTMTWVSTPAFFAPTVVVSSINPISGGQDAENDATARSRLLDYFRNPPGAGNPAQLARYAQSADPAVQNGFVYPAARGPGTVDICVIGYADSNNGNRVLDNSLLVNTISPYVLGNIPQYVDGYVCNVVNYPMDLSIALSLPSAPTASPAGPGGGWIDSSPLHVTTAKPSIRVIDGYALSGNNPAVPRNTSISFFLDMPVAPISLIQYNISYFSTVTGTYYTGVTSGTYIKASTTYGSLAAYPDLYYVSVNTPFYSSGTTPILPGDWVFPTANNSETYVNAVKNIINTMGPGERTTVSGLLPRALRQPISQSASPYRLNDTVLKSVTSSGTEVNDSSWLFRGAASDRSVTPTGLYVDYATKTVGSDPAYAKYQAPTTYAYFGTMLAPCFVFTLGNIGFYPAQD